MKSSAYHGLLVIDKPNGMTSRDVVNRIQTWFPRGTRIGHTGTLDPLATGVLVICVGTATRLSEYVQRMGKTYRARLRLGATSTTDDADGAIQSTQVNEQPDHARVADCLQGFLGEIDQVPPAFSAVKVTGRRAHDLARGGEDFVLTARRVTIYRTDILTYQYPQLEIEVQCGKGTYIRSLARDLGNRLGCGALVEELRRTRVGPFTVASALSLGDTAEKARSSLLPVAAAVSELPQVQLDADLARRLRHGQIVSYPHPLEARLQNLVESNVAVFDRAMNLVGVATLNVQGTLVPLKVLAEQTADSVAE